MNKVYTKEVLVQHVARWRVQGNNIVFTNGCFDLLHAGHIEVLKQAKTFGDKLIIGLNADMSVKKLKGETRPIINQNYRATLLSSIEYVDAVIFFEEDTPIRLIELIKPDILVKGGDWEKEQIVGASFVQNYGGEVKTIPMVDGLSTTSIMKKIKEL